MPNNRAALDAALGPQPKKRATGDPGGPKACTEACIRVEAKLAQGCKCEWRCWKETQYAKTKHIRFALHRGCLKHSTKAIEEIRDGQRP